MKFFTVILLVLAFGPSLLDLVLSGHYVPAPTPVYPTKTFTDAFTICKATVQVPPTAMLVRDHNKSAGLPILSFYGKIFSIDSTISISTESQVTSSFTRNGDVAFTFKLIHHAQTLWNATLHWSQHVSGRLIDGVIVFSLYLWTFFAVGLALLQLRAPHHAHLTSEQVVQLEDGRAPVAWIQVQSVEGLLLLYSYATYSPESADQWKCLWIPRRQYTHYLCNGPANREVVHNAADTTLLGILLQTVSTYQPWAPELASTLLATHARCLKSELPVQSQHTFGHKQRSVRRPHFLPSIHRIGGRPTHIVNEVVSEVVNPRRERVLVDWVKISSDEGALILYGYSNISTGKPTEWTSQWFPRQPHTYYLSDRPANRGSLLLDILLRSISIYHPWAPLLAGVLLDLPGGVFEETSIAAATDFAIEVEVATPLCQTSRPNTPDLSAAINAPMSLMTSFDDSLDMKWEATGPLIQDMGGADHFDNTKVEATSTLLPPGFPSVSVSSENHSFPPSSQSTCSEPEVSTESTCLTGSSFPSRTITIPSLSYNTASYQHFPTVYNSYPSSSNPHHAPMIYHPYPYGAQSMYQQTPTSYQPYSLPVAYPRFPTVHHHYPSNQMAWQPLTAEQAAVAREAMRPSLPPLAERASERNASGLWAPGSTGLEEATGENEPEEVLKKKFRRGGKRKTARRLKWEEFERQRRDEGGPEAGASAPN
ncbi:hypothetical protein FS837_002101 [Tulasnella sp. UAMH 9824]|nr:hypothetical protein FS837_002101 [Tulasnella sp. UAMH 9824]